VTQPVASPEQYRRRARHFFQMAQNCKDSQIAHHLRVIAADYLDAGQVGDKAPNGRNKSSLTRKPRSDPPVSAATAEDSGWGSV